MIKSFKSNKGFTLVELIIVIAILAIIMLIAIPNFSGIQQRMQVRADKSTAAQIGKAVRVWFTDYTTDKGLVEAAAEGSYVPVEGKNADDEDLNGLPTTGAAVPAVDYSLLSGISGYISTGKTPDSLKKDDGSAEDYQFYCITLSENATSEGAKILVSICKGTEQTNDNGTTDDTSDDFKYGVVGAGDFPAKVTGDPADYDPWAQANYDGSRPAVAYIEP